MSLRPATEGSSEPASDGPHRRCCRVSDVSKRVLIAVCVVALVGPLLPLLFRCWFAMEACLIGRYGPVDAVRVSRGVTTAYRGKLLRLAAGVVLTLGIGS